MSEGEAGTDDTAGEADGLRKIIHVDMDAFFASVDQSKEAMTSVASAHLRFRSNSSNAFAARRPFSQPLIRAL